MSATSTAGDAETIIRDAMRYHARQAVDNGYADTGVERSLRSGDDACHAKYHACNVLRLEQALAALVGTEKAQETRHDAWHDSTD